MNLLRSPALALAALLLLAFLLYLPGLQGNFILDDYANIVNNSQVHLERLDGAGLAAAWDSGIASTLQRPLAMLSFAANHLFSGMNPYYFKLTNLLIHLLTTLGVYLLVRELARSASNAADERSCQLFALFVTACWALHPLNVSTVLYVVQRMTQLATLASVFALYLYCRWRRQPLRSPLQALLLLGALALLTIAGILGKENAVLTPFLLLGMEYFIFRFRAASNGDRWFLRLLLLGGLVLPLAGILVLLLLNPVLLLGDYSIRSFTMAERVLTQTRVLWSYIGWLLLPTGPALSFFHDDYTLSRSLLNPPTTALASAGLIAVFALIWRLRLSRPLTSFGLAFFFIGQLLESTVVNLELVFEHRNYLPGLGIMLALADTLFRLPQQYFEQGSKRLLLGALLLYLGLNCHLEARKWGNTFEHVRQIVQDHPGSHRANYMLGMLYSLAAPRLEDPRPALLQARQLYEQSMRLNDESLDAYFGYIMTQAALDEPSDPDIMQKLLQRLESGHLMADGFPQVSRLTDCWYSGHCKLELDDLLALYNAIARNEVEEAIVVQGILDQIGSAMVANFGLPEHGKALLYLARSKRSAVTMIDLKLIQLEHRSGNTQTALQLAEQALANNPGALRTELEDARRLLLEQSAKP